MFKLKFTCFISLAIFSFFTSAKCEFKCDVHLQVNEPRPFFTIAGYKTPLKNYTRINESVLCPCSSARPCLRKCCLRDYIYIASTKKCHLINKTRADFENLQNISIEDYTLVYGSLCPRVERSLETLKVLEDGSLELQHYYLPLQKYCIDYFEDKEDFWLLECQEPTSETSVWMRKILLICLGFSVVCLIVTLFVYSCNKELRNVPGKVLLCYVSSFLTTELCLIGMQFISVSPGIICVTAGKFFQDLILVRQSRILKMSTI